VTVALMHSRPVPSASQLSTYLGVAWLCWQYFLYAVDHSHCN